MPAPWSLVLYIPSDLFSTRSFTYGCSFAFNFCVALRIVITDTADWALNVNNISVCVALRTVDTVITDTADWALNINNICVCVARAKADLSHAVGLGSDVMIVVWGCGGAGGGGCCCLFLVCSLAFNHPKEWREDVKRSDGERMTDWGIQSVQPRPTCPISLQTSPATYLKCRQSFNQSVNQLINIFLSPRLK